MSVVKYVPVLVNSPLIVESFVFLVHMKFSLLKDLQRECGLCLDYQQTYRAKEKSLQRMHSLPKDSYTLITWICDRLKESDNGLQRRYLSFRWLGGNVVHVNIAPIIYIFGMSYITIDSYAFVM